MDRGLERELRGVLGRVEVGAGEEPITGRLVPGRRQRRVEHDAHGAGEIADGLGLGPAQPERELGVRVLEPVVAHESRWVVAQR
ncbi:MAG: hypothetical protein RL531_1466, partial [Actinomycetota bacterium]